MSWPSTLLLSLSQVAGVGGLGLGLYNFWAARRAPMLADQRELRSELRKYLVMVREECEFIISAINQPGRVVLWDTAPNHIGGGERSMININGLLLSPGPKYALPLQDQFRELTSYWRSMPPSIKQGNPELSEEENEVERRQVARDLEPKLRAMLKSVNEFVDMLNEIDNDKSSRSFKKYQE